MKHNKQKQRMRTLRRLGRYVDGVFRTHSTNKAEVLKKLAGAVNSRCRMEKAKSCMSGKRGRHSRQNIHNSKQIFIGLRGVSSRSAGKKKHVSRRRWFSRGGHAITPTPHPPYPPRWRRAQATKKRREVEFRTSLPAHQFSYHSSSRKRITRNKNKKRGGGI